MPISFKVDNVEISALRDRVMFNTFAGNKSYVCKGFGNELAVTSSSTSFIVSLGSGEAVICGGSMICEGESPTLTLPANQSGYLVIRIDLSQTEANICQFKNVSSIVQGNINNGTDLIYDLPLYQYTTNNDGVASLTSVRTIYESQLDSLDNKFTQINNSIAGKAPKNHASTATTYGLGTKNNYYGHVKIIDSLTQTSYQDGTALSAYQGKVLNDKITTLTNSVNGKAPTKHASANTTYGLGTTTLYGHVKTINALTQTSHQDGTALSAYQGKVLSDRIHNLENEYTQDVIDNWAGIIAERYDSNGKLDRRINGVVTLHLNFKYTGGRTINDLIQFTSLPVGYRPPRQVDINVLTTSGMCVIRIQPDGKCLIGLGLKENDVVRTVITYVTSTRVS